MIKKLFSFGFITWLAILGLAAGLGYQFVERDKTDAAQLQSLAQASAQQQQALQQISEILTTYDQQFQQIAQHSNQIVTNVKELDAIVRGDNQTWRLMQIQNYLEMAMIQATLLNDTNTAIHLLAAAENNLKTINNPNLIPVRKALQADIATLASNPLSNLTQIILALENISNAVSSLPHKIKLDKDFTTETSPTPPEENKWEQRAQTLWQEIKSLIRIQRHDQPITPYFSQNDTVLINQNLHLLLEQASFAAAHHYSVLYQQLLQQAQVWLKQYYDLNDPKVQEALTTLAQLQTMPVASDANLHLKTVDAWATFIASTKVERE